MAIKNNYSKRELDRQISSSYFERYLLSGRKELQPKIKTIDEDDYPNTRILDIYSLEFLDLPDIGDEYKIQVGNHDFFRFTFL